MNEADFRAATADMGDTALWDVRRVALQSARRDDATPVRYFEDAVTEALRSLHRISQECLWDELQKHELGKRTLRSLAAEYKPARMVAFEPDDLRKASVRFWEALRTEDEAIREALAAYNYGAVAEQLAALSRTMEREVVARLVYINCPRQNVVEEVVGTVMKCTTNELKMLASKLYDRLDKTSTLSPENREMAKQLPLCRTKEELRVAVRDLLLLFKRKQPFDDNSNIIGPSIATVTVSYKGQQRQVAAVVRIERLDKVLEEPKILEGPSPPEPRRPSAGGGSEAASSSSSRSSKMNSVVTVGSNRTIPPTPPNDTKTVSEHLVPAAAGSGGDGSFLSSKAPSSVLTSNKEKDWDIPNSLPPLRSPKGPSSDVGSMEHGLKHKATSGSSQIVPPSPPLAAAHRTPGGPASDVGSVARSGVSHRTAAAAAAANTSNNTNRSTRPTPGGSAVGGPAGASSSAGSGLYAVASKSGPGSVKSVSSSARSSQSALATPDPGKGGVRASAGGSSQHVYGSISFDRPGVPLPKPLPADHKNQPGADPWDTLNDGGSNRSASPSSASSSSLSSSAAAAFHAAAARGAAAAAPKTRSGGGSREPSRSGSSKSLIPQRSVASSGGGGGSSSNNQFLAY